MPMPKMCWKCGKYHEEGVTSCPYCGANFTSENDKYMSDGRTVSNKDETAYLSAPPPRYKSSRMILPAVIILVMVVAFIVITASGFPGGSDADVRYDYDMRNTDIIKTDGQGYVKPDEGMIFVVMKIEIFNDRITTGVSDDVDKWEFSLGCKGEWYHMDSLTRHYYLYHHPSIIGPGESSTFYEIFQIPEGQGPTEVNLDYHGSESVKQDGSILR